MKQKSPESAEEISQADWEKTPESVKRLVVNLNERNEQLGKRVEILERQYEELKAENQLLKEQLKQNSKNSSKSPSQDIDKGFKAKEKKGRSKKKAGNSLGMRT